MTNIYHVRRFMWMGLMTCGVALAGSPSSYLGFTFNLDKASTEKILASRQAVFDSGYGYRGYGKDLPSIKLKSDPIINKHGPIKEAWLNFTPPPHRLYQVFVTWGDSGSTYTLLKDVLDQKYKSDKARHDGFVVTHQYLDGDVQITLIRNNFGFGERQTTTLKYVYLPDIHSVNVRKAQIDKDIKKQKIKSAGGDL